MMNQMANFKYTEGEGYQAVELPYDGEELSMVVFLPASGKFQTFESALTPERLTEIVSGMSSVSVDLSMPKFKTDYDLGMKAVLSEMGMPTAFSDSADFSGMNGTGGLVI
jgi:serpin B